MRLFLYSMIIISLLISSCDKKQIKTEMADDEKPCKVDVCLNHLSIIVDSVTYSEISSSKFLKNKFADFMQASASTDDNQTWSGAYLTGEHTYLEIFNKTGISIPTAGIGFCTEKEGDIDHLAKKLNKSMGEKILKVDRKRKINDTAVPWFSQIRFDKEKNNLVLKTWIIEYDKNYLRNVVEDKDEEYYDISRKQYNERYYDAYKLMEDISHVRMALDEKTTDKLLQKMKAFNYDMKESGKHIICTGPSIEITIVPATPTIFGIRELVFKLNRNKEGEKVFKFGGKSVLVFRDDKTAIWTF